MLNRRKEVGDSRKDLTSLRSAGLAQKGRALPVPILHGARKVKISSAQLAPPQSTNSQPESDSLSEGLQACPRASITTSPSSEESPSALRTGPRMKGALRPPLPSPTWANQDEHHPSHPNEALSSQHSDVKAQARAVTTLSEPLASGNCLQWEQSLSSLKKAAPPPQVPDPTQFQASIIVNPVMAGKTTARSLSDRKLEPFGDRLGDGSKTLGGRTRRVRGTVSKRETETRRAKETVKTREPGHPQEAWSAEETQKGKLTTKQSSNPIISSGHMRRRSHCRQDQTGSKLPRIEYQTVGTQAQSPLADCTTRARTTYQDCVQTAASFPSTAERVTTAPSIHQNLPQAYRTRPFPKDSSSHTSLISTWSRKPFPPTDTISLRPSRREKHIGSRYTFDTLNEQATRCRRMSAPAALGPLHATTTIACQVSELALETTSTFNSVADSQERLVEIQASVHEDLSESGLCRLLGAALPTEGEGRHNRDDRGAATRDIAKNVLDQYSEEEGWGSPFTTHTNYSHASFRASSDGDSDTPSENDDAHIGHETPLTSPCTSPMKRQSPVRLHLPVARKEKLVQLDGPIDIFRESPIQDSIGQQSSEEQEHVEGIEHGNGRGNSIDETTFSRSRSPSHSRYFSSVEFLPDLSTDEACGTALEIDDFEQEIDDTTPLVSPSPAKGAKAFPFPEKLSKTIPQRALSCMRRPSALLKHCEGLATPRQRRLMKGGARTPDRFVPLRAATPTKDAFLLSKSASKLSISRRDTGRRSPPTDPFGPTPRRSLRMAEQFATIRTPPPAPRTVGLRTSLVPNAEPPTRRSASAGAVWSVGGTTTTEGVASVTNGRGGRVTSSTSAPHYAADFLRRNTPSDEELTHGRRLAFAMDIDQSARMLDHSLPSSPSTGSPKSSRGKDGRVWRNGGWEDKSSPLTPTKARPKKTKDIPIIPFRVLNAPALRDDYYCSLLAYSSTLNCLAVGLGPHVYLWTEKKANRSNIPDSLTAPVGSAHVTSLSFSSFEGCSAILAIGRSDGRITLWSPLDSDPRFDSEQPAPISCVCFRPNSVQRASIRDPVAAVATEELLVGDEVGFVYFYSIEWPGQEQRDLFGWHGSMTLLARITCHSQQICGLAWSLDGEFFATGGNDNQMFLFETKKALKPRAPTTASSPRTAITNPLSVRVRGGTPVSSRPTPNNITSASSIPGQREVLPITPGHQKHTFTLNAAVKAIAFAPWQSTLLAAGGGSNDRCIHFFHTLSGATLATIDCHAQVTSLVWSSRRKEIAATFGFAQPEHPHRVAVFAWPSCEMVVKIPWFTEERALYGVADPRGPRGGAQPDAEGRPWYGKRTREEGCLVVATSDASIKFHEIWAERRGGVGGKRVDSGVLGGSRILEGECSEELERRGVIR